jgi:hypothetical protein
VEGAGPVGYGVLTPQRSILQVTEGVIQPANHTRHKTHQARLLLLLLWLLLLHVDILLLGGWLLLLGCLLLLRFNAVRRLLLLLLCCWDLLLSGRWLVLWLLRQL